MFEFDADTAIERVGEDLFRGSYTERWNIGPVPNGGYVFCVGLRALAQLTDHPDPVTATAHYLRPGVPGPVDIRVETAKAGRSFATLAATLSQNGKEHLRVLATFGDLGEPEPPRYSTTAPPSLPPIDECARQGNQQEHVVPQIVRRFDAGIHPEDIGGIAGQPTGKAVMRGYMRFADERPIDVLSLALFADALAPPAFNVLPRGWVPTLELTVHFRARPEPTGHLRTKFETRAIGGGLLDEDGELFDSTGRLVAMSRQLAGVPRGQI